MMRQKCSIDDQHESAIGDEDPHTFHHLMPHPWHKLPRDALTFPGHSEPPHRRLVGATCPAAIGATSASSRTNPFHPKPMPLAHFYGFLR
ncbi:hypothetical protein ACP4OV_016906 [Aristida adscensionis]